MKLLLLILFLLITSSLPSLCQEMEVELGVSTSATDLRIHYDGVVEGRPKAYNIFTVSPRLGISLSIDQNLRLNSHISYTNIKQDLNLKWERTSILQDTSFVGEYRREFIDLNFLTLEYRNPLNKSVDYYFLGGINPSYTSYKSSIFHFYRWSMTLTIENGVILPWTKHYSLKLGLGYQYNGDIGISTRPTISHSRFLFNLSILRAV